MNLKFQQAHVPSRNGRKRPASIKAANIYADGSQLLCQGVLMCCLQSLVRSTVRMRCHTCNSSVKSGVRHGLPEGLPNSATGPERLHGRCYLLAQRILNLQLLGG